MGKHGEAFQKKQDNKEQKRRIRTKKSVESHEITEKHHIDNRLITETPFLPRMKEHADILAGIKFTTQRNNFIQQLHRTYGSRYVQRLVTSLNVQAKLTVSDPNDIYEQEADRIADNVTRTINSPAQRQPEEEEELLQGKFDIHREAPEEEELLQGKTDIQRATPAEEEELLQGKLDIQREAPEEEEELQMRPKEDHDSIVADSLEKHINQTRGGGYSLSENIREPMEQAFRADFSWNPLSQTHLT